MKEPLKTYLMYWNKIKVTAIVFLVVLSAFTVKAQVKDSTSTSDVIIRVDGSIIYGKVLEVSQDEVKYLKNDIPDGPEVTLPREQVYVISYSNNTKQVITPVFGKRKLDEPAFDANSMESDEDSDTTKNLKYNIAHGDIRVGMGFSRAFSSFKGVDDFSKESSAPSLFAAYQIRYNRFLKVGVSLGYASFNYEYNRTSDYDGIAISQSISESVASLGIYGRYDLMSGFIKPYLLVGLNFNYTAANMEGDVEFIDEGKHVLTTSGINGFKNDVVARAGVDFMISKSFGLYSDIGTGTSLIQIGAIFSLK
jgi:hypothetical protein